MCKYTRIVEFIGISKQNCQPCIIWIHQQKFVADLLKWDPTDRDDSHSLDFCLLQKWMCFSTQCTHPRPHPHPHPPLTNSAKYTEFTHEKWFALMMLLRFGIYCTPNNTAPKISPAIKQCQVLRTNKISIRVFGCKLGYCLRNPSMVCKCVSFVNSHFPNWNRKPHRTRCMSSTCDILGIYAWNETNIEQK